VNGEGRDTPGPRPVVVPTTTDSKRLACERVRAIDRQCRNARLAEQAMPLVVYYAGRPLRRVPLGRYLAERWWMP
jgi:hypothetical protein